MITREEAYNIVREKYSEMKILASMEAPVHYSFSVRVFTPTNNTQFGDLITVEVNKETGKLENTSECETLRWFFPEEFKEVQKTIVDYEKGDSK